MYLFIYDFPPFEIISTDINTRMNKELLEKYFNQTCTSDEARQVMLWFKTKQGNAYLKKTLEKDYGSVMAGAKLQYPAEIEPDFDKMFSDVERRTQRPYLEKVNYQHVHRISRDTRLTYYRALAAAVILITTSLIYLFLYEQPQQFSDLTELTVYVTGDADQKILTLKDGSVIHMNQNSEIHINSDPHSAKRQIQLRGEAYFQVTHNPERIFRVESGNAVIEVLGTEFNVRNTEHGELHVAVTDGSVSLISSSSGNQQDAVILEKGQNTIFNSHTNQMVVENHGVQNYLAWRTGRLVFEDLPLETVCVQLQRLYGISCSFQQVELKELRLTSHFAIESLENTLSVIAQSLRIKYELDGEIVLWTNLTDYINDLRL
jgi:transmembrane sensor